MPVNQVFLDTSGLLALINRSDDLYQKAASINLHLARTNTLLVTTDWVLMEFLSGTARLPLRSGGVRMITSLRTSIRTTIVEADRSSWDRAFDFFKARLDKGWSLVDCSSMLICKDRGISRVFTSDPHFQQFGLEILLDPQPA